jgi:hypothetical protein
MPTTSARFSSPDTSGWNCHRSALTYRRNPGPLYNRYAVALPCRAWASCTVVSRRSDGHFAVLKNTEDLIFAAEVLEAMAQGPVYAYPRSVLSTRYSQITPLPPPLSALASRLVFVSSGRINIARHRFLYSLCITTVLLTCHRLASL